MNMGLNQYAVYQMKNDASLRQIRYKSYQYLMENRQRVDAGNYRQVYLATMPKEKKVEEIRTQLEKKLPKRFEGSALNVSDVIAVTKEGVSSAYYVDKDSLVVIPGFFRSNSSAALISMDTEGFHLKGRNGTWMAADETVIDGKHFFLMVSEMYGRSAAYAVVDAWGRQVADDTVQGFNEETIRQIRESMRKAEAKIENAPEKNSAVSERPQMEHWQKSYENGEYVRSAEAYGEQNYDMIDGRVNNRPKNRKKAQNGKRESVLKRLKAKQAEVAMRYGKNLPEQVNEERNRK